MIYATCCGLEQVNNRISCSYEIAISTTMCFGCNGAADTHDRRLLSGPASRAVLSAWMDIITVAVQTDSSLETIAAQLEASANTGHLCRKCFNLFDRYQKIKVLQVAQSTFCRGE